MTEFNDIYDRERNLTGRVHRRGTPGQKGEYGLVVCVWVYDGKGKDLLTFTKFSGLDPEGTSNVYAAQYPMSRQFTVGLDLKF